MIRNDKKLISLSIILLSLWGIIYWDALVGMESIWRRSDTFAHGYFIFPIVLWLFWRDRAYLLNSNAHTSWLPLPVIAGSLFVWLFSYAADINVLGQLSAVVTLVCIIWLLLGNKLAWHYKFPLAYLIFLVPMGENLIPDLQDITAWFTVAFLKIHGIPVFRDGLYIQVPSGLFEVAVACSGIRYLIASVAVGTLFAYLSYRSFKKQILFIIFAFLLPILANGIRAYMIVIIAHYSDMKYATGADHLVYGWVFFGFVIMLMFWVGGKFSDPELTDKDLAENAKINANIEKYSYPLIGAAAILLITSQILRLNIPVTITPAAPQKSISTFPVSKSQDWGITYTHPLAQSFVFTEDNIEVYRAVFANKQTVGEMITYENFLYNHDRWTIIDREAIEFNGHKAKYLLLRNIVGRERVVVYWYRVGNDVVLSNNLVKINQVVALFLKPSAQSEIIAFSAIGDEASKLFDKILKRAPAIEEHFINIKAVD